MGRVFVRASSRARAYTRRGRSSIVRSRRLVKAIRKLENRLDGSQRGNFTFHRQAARQDKLMDALIKTRNVKKIKFEAGHRVSKYK